MSALTDTFRALHAAGTFVMPNPWDAGSARYLEWRGFPALATTSSGFAATLGRLDRTVVLDEVLAHVEAITAAVSIPVNVDSERLYADDPAGVARSVELLASAGAAGCSIEDYNPALGRCDDVGVAAERVAAAAEAAARHGVLLTARAEQHLFGSTDLDDTIARLLAYREAGAECVYAPGVIDPDGIARLVAETGAPVNVLAMPGVPDLATLTALGVRRISTGGGLAWHALGALKGAVDEILGTGAFAYTATGLPRDERTAALGPRIGG